MALLFLESFDAQNIASKWTASSIVRVPSTLYGRRGSKGFSTGGGSGVYLTKSFTPTSMIIVGLAIYTPNASRNKIQFKDPSGTVHFYVYWYESTLTIKNGDGTLLQTITLSPWVAFSWNYLEIKVHIDNTNGTWEVHWNESSMGSGTGDTQNSATATIGAITFCYSSETGAGDDYYDDIYICDDSGTVNNNFMGDCRVDAIVPDGAGYSTQWTPSAGSNYQCVDETPENTSDYVSATVLDSIDSYTMGNLPAGVTGDICGILLSTYAKRADTGIPTKIKPFVRTNSTDFLGTERELSNVWAAYPEIWEQNPDTAAAWSIAEINALETGVKLTVVT
jgi:hypothetical protein